MKLAFAFFVVVIVALGALLAAPDSDILFKREFGYFGSKYRSVIRRSDLPSYPKWLESEPFPPLAMRRAMEAARALLNQRFAGASWVITHIELIPIPDGNGSAPEHSYYWAYVVGYDGVPRSEFGGDWQEAGIIVAMDGRCIIPEKQ